MRGDLSVLETLWESTPPLAPPLGPGALTALPETPRRFLAHAIAPGVPPATAVRLRMHGEIRLGRWWPFTAEEVIHRDRGMIWRASVRMHGLPVRGSDRLLDGEGRMRWSLLGLVPVVRAGGPDITRSGAGSLAAESVWLPSVLGGDDVDWTALDDARARARFAVMGHPVDLTLTIAGDGRLQRLTLPRWGNPDGGPFRELSFGGVVEAEATFGAYTIPTRLRIGWHPDGDVCESGGEFFRVTVDEARYR